MAFKKAIRFSFKLILVLFVLLVIIVYLLESGAAGKYILHLASGRTGLDLEASRIDLGLDGRIRIREFSAKLPDEEADFFSSPRIDIHMNSIGEIIRKFGLGIREIRVLSPVLAIREDQYGRLNIQKVIDSLRTPDKEPGEPFEMPELPDITITDARISFERFERETIAISPVQFRSESTAEKTEFSLSLPGNNFVAGEIEQDLSHQVTMRVRDLPELLTEITDLELPEIRARADWLGQIKLEDAFLLSGNLNIAQLDIASVETSATARIEVTSETATARIDRIEVQPWRPLANLENEPDAIIANAAMVEYNYAETLLSIEDMVVFLLQGQMTLNGEISPTRWSETAAGGIKFQNIRPGDLASVLAETEMTGQMDFEPAEDLRPLEPIALSLRMQLENPALQNAQLQEIQAQAFLGPNRLITSNVEIPIFGGRILPWINISRRNGELFANIVTDFGDINLDTAVKTFSPDASDVPGLINGTARLRSFGQLETSSGTAELSITESDLVNAPVISTIYGALVIFGAPDQRGSGAVKLSLQGNQLEITSFDYFNRGVEILGSGIIENILLGSEAPIDGIATGSLQPLRDVDLPGSQAISEFIKGIQAGFVSVRVEGTIGDIESRIVPLPEIEGALRRLLRQ